MEAHFGLLDALTGVNGSHRGVQNMLVHMKNVRHVLYVRWSYALLIAFDAELGPRGALSSGHLLLLLAALCLMEAREGKIADPDSRHDVLPLIRYWYVLIAAVDNRRDSTLKYIRFTGRSPSEAQCTKRQSRCKDL